MARWLVVLASLLLAAPTVAQQTQDQQFKEAGVCSRCHVISVVEWGMSGHRQAATNCVACHGSSQGHVVDERNNVKPERLPHDAAIAGLCASCHASGCPKTGRTDSCQDCHHVHALINPNTPSTVSNEALETKAEAWDRYSQQMEVAERHFRSGEWRQARGAFRAALEERPGEPRARRRIEACERRIQGILPGFEIVGESYDTDTGLPSEVRVSGLGIPMVLVAGGQFEMGSETYPSATPVHTVRIEPFYLAKYELTEAEWKAVVGDGKTSQMDKMPVHEVSWDDAQKFLRAVNQKVAGGGFRLPTEAEWEFAAHAAAASGPDLARVAWYGASEETGVPQPVGAKGPDRFGLFDMQGNVWEWCSSLSKPYPYDATDGRESPHATGLRVLRGGGYADPADMLNPRMRHGERPNRRLRWNGMRLARSVP